MARRKRECPLGGGALRAVPAGAGLEDAVGVDAEDLAAAPAAQRLGNLRETRNGSPNLQVIRSDLFVLGAQQNRAPPYLENL